MARTTLIAAGSLTPSCKRLKIDGEEILFMYADTEGNVKKESGTLDSKTEKFETENGQSGKLAVALKGLTIKWTQDDYDSESNFKKESTADFEKNLARYQADVKAVTDAATAETETSESNATTTSSSDSSSNTSTDAAREEELTAATKRIIDSLKGEIVGNWRRGEQNGTWRTYQTLELTADGKIKLTEQMPKPESAKVDLTYTGTYTLDEATLKELLDEKTRTDANAVMQLVDFQLTDLNSYEDYYDQTAGEITMAVSLDETGTVKGAPVTKHIDSQFTFSHTAGQINYMNIDFYTGADSMGNFTKMP